MSAEFGPSGGGVGIATGSAGGARGGIEGGIGSGLGSFGSSYGSEVGPIGIGQGPSPGTASFAEIGAPTISQGPDSFGGRHIATKNPFSGTELLSLSPSLPNLSMDTKIVGTPSQFLGSDYATLWSMPTPITGSEMTLPFSQPSFDSLVTQSENIPFPIAEPSAELFAEIDGFLENNRQPSIEPNLFADIDSFLQSSSQPNAETDMVADIQSFLQKEASLSPQAFPETETQSPQNVLSSSEQEALKRLTMRIESVLPTIDVGATISPAQETIDSVESFLRSTSQIDLGTQESTQPDNLVSQSEEVEALSIEQETKNTHPSEVTPSPKFFADLKKYTPAPPDPGGRVARLDGGFVTIAKGKIESKPTVAAASDVVIEATQITPALAFEDITLNVDGTNQAITAEQIGLIEDNVSQPVEPPRNWVAHTSNDVVADPTETIAAVDEGVQSSEGNAAIQELVEDRVQELEVSPRSESSTDVRVSQMDQMATELKADAKVKARIAAIVLELLDEDIDDVEATQALRKISASVSLQTAEPSLEELGQEEVKVTKKTEAVPKVVTSTNEQQETVRAAITVQHHIIENAEIVEQIIEDSPEVPQPKTSKTAIIDNKITERRVVEIDEAYDEARNIVVDAARENPPIDEDGLIIPGELAAKILSDKSIENDPELKSTIAGENSDKTLVHTINEVADIDIAVGELDGNNAKSSLKIPVYNHPAVTVDFEPTAATEEQVDEVFDPIVKKKGGIFNAHSHLAQSAQLTRT